jgi:hypothetical protein
MCSHFTAGSLADPVRGEAGGKGPRSVDDVAGDLQLHRGIGDGSGQLEPSAIANGLG